MTMFLALWVVSPTATSPGAVILPQPFSQSTLFFLKRNRCPGVESTWTLVALHVREIDRGPVRP